MQELASHDRSIKRFVKYLAKQGECIIWTGNKNHRGYGLFKPTHGPMQSTHKFFFEAVKGPVPAGKQLDHLCRVRACCNPFHLEAVTARENILRGLGHAAINSKKTHCPAGHAYDEANTAHISGRRRCRACARAKAMIRYYRKEGRN